MQILRSTLILWKGYNKYFPFFYDSFCMTGSTHLKFKMFFEKEAYSWFDEEAFSWSLLNSQYLIVAIV